MTLAMFVIGTPLLFQGLKNQLVASVRYVEERRKPRTIGTEGITFYP